MLESSSSSRAAPRANESARECAAYREFVTAWQRGERPRLEAAIAQLDAGERDSLLPDFVAADVFYRHQRGERPSRDDYERLLGSDAPAIAATFPRDPASTQFSHATDSLMGSRASTMPLPRAMPERRPKPEYGARNGPTLGRYQLRSVLGRGGFGMVWLAHDSLLDREVAIKIPHVHDALGDEVRQEMIEEARRVARLDLPGVVPVYDFCELSGQSFVVSRYMEGGTLSDYRERNQVGFVEAARLAAQIAHTLHQAHLRNIVHRDIKPGNILLDESGEPWVADFGLAVTEDEQETEPQTVMGTISYMSPELARGENRYVDARTDIYSLGMVLYELLTGRVAFHGSSSQNLLEQIGHRPPRPPRTINDTVPAELERICLKCLAKDVDQRYLNAGDLAADLEQWLEERSAAPAVSRSASGLPKRVLVYAAGGVVILAAVLLAASGWTPPFLNNPSAVGGGNGQLPGGGTSTGEEPDYEQPNRWHDLLAREPVELAGPGEGLQRNWDRRQRTLAASALYPTLIELGSTSEPNYQVRITIRQTPWTGRVGLFFGYGNDDVVDSPIAQYRLIHISQKHPARSGDLALFRSVMSQEKSGRHAIEMSDTRAVQDIAFPGQSTVKLEVEVRDGKIHRVAYNDQDCTNLTADPGALRDDRLCVGAFGVYLENSSVGVEKAEYRFTR